MDEKLSNVVQTGTVRGRVKSRRTSILLAAFLGPWTWLYTAKQDWRKLVWGLVLAAVAWGFIVSGEFLIWLLQLQDPEIVWVPGLVISVITLVAIQAWAVVDTVTKPESWYAAYGRREDSVAV